MNIIGTFEKRSVLRGIHLWNMSYISLRNEIKFQKMDFFTTSEVIRDHFHLCSSYSISIYLNRKPFQKNKIKCLTLF
jgi:hypothetical protein